MKTWPASPLSMARSVSFSPTTKADAFNSSNVMNLPLLLLSNFTQHWNYIITVMQCQQNDGAFLLYSCRTLYNGLGRIIYVFIPFYPKRVIETVPPDFSRLTYLNKYKKFLKTEKTTSKFIIDIFIYTYKLLCKIFVFFPYPLQVAKFISLQ